MQNIVINSSIWHAFSYTSLPLNSFNAISKPDDGTVMVETYRSNTQT
jgi:hypothetical protein